jgi:hypothetical protein
MTKRANRSDIGVDSILYALVGAYWAAFMIGITYLELFSGCGLSGQNQEL